MTTTPRISVVIPAYERAAMVRNAVLSVLNQTLPHHQYEVLLVDSTPSEAVWDAVKDIPEVGSTRFRYLRKKPEGPGPSRNLGAREARGEFIAFMDSDCLATPDWLAAALKRFEPGVGMVQGAVRLKPDAVPGVFSVYLVVNAESPLYETANIVYRREAFEAGGGFPPDLHPHATRPMGGEDVELAWRVKRLGWTARFAPDALVYHEVIPISKWEWVYHKSLFIFPRLVRDIPELRPFFFGRYFFSEAQAWLVVALIGTALSVVSPWALGAWIPYVVHRGGGQTATLHGFRRPIRLVAYSVRDVVGLMTLVAGSVRYRALLL